MSWPRCKIFLYNVVQIVTTLQRTIADIGNHRLKPLEKITEFAGGTLELEALGSDEIVLESDVAKGWEILKSTNKWLSDMEDGGNGGARPEAEV